MISLGRFLAHKRESAISHLNSLLAAIARTALRTENADREVFQERVESAIARIDADTEDHVVATEVGVIIQALEHYNTVAEQRSAAQQRELRLMIAAGLDTVAAIGSSSEAGIQQMRTLETKLESACAIDDLRALRGKLLACLTLVRNETVRMHMESQRLVQSLKASALRASSELKPGSDGITGLPGPAALQKTLQRPGSEPEPRHVAVFVINDLITINATYGRTAGDEVLRFTSEYLSRGFIGLGKIHRWNGPAFVIAADTSIKAELFKEKALLLSRDALVIPLPADGDSKKLNASLSSMLETLPSGELTDGICRNLDAFVAKHIGPVHY